MPVNVADARLQSYIASSLRLSIVLDSKAAVSRLTERVRTSRNDQAIDSHLADLATRVKVNSPSCHAVPGALT